MKFIIDEKLANSILNYLAGRPYVEVANLIQGLQTLIPHDDGVKQDASRNMSTPPPISDGSPFAQNIK